MPYFTPEAATPNPSDEMIEQMAWKLCIVPTGAPVHRAIGDILRRQYIAAHEVAAENAGAMHDDAWKAGYSVSRGTTDRGEVVSIRLPHGYGFDLPRSHAVYLHNLMAAQLAPARQREGN